MVDKEFRASAWDLDWIAPNRYQLSEKKPSNAVSSARSLKCSIKTVDAFFKRLSTPKQTLWFPYLLWKKL